MPTSRSPQRGRAGEHRRRPGPPVRSGREAGTPERGPGGRRPAPRGERRASAMLPSRGARASRAARPPGSVGPLTDLVSSPSAFEGPDERVAGFAGRGRDRLQAVSRPGVEQAQAVRADVRRRDDPDPCSSIVGTPTWQPEQALCIMTHDRGSRPRAARVRSARVRRATAWPRRSSRGRGAPRWSRCPDPAPCPARRAGRGGDLRSLRLAPSTCRSATCGSRLARSFRERWTYSSARLPVRVHGHLPRARLQPAKLRGRIAGLDRAPDARRRSMRATTRTRSLRSRRRRLRSASVGVFVTTTTAVRGEASRTREDAGGRWRPSGPATTKSAVPRRGPESQAPWRAPTRSAATSRRRRPSRPRSSGTPVAAFADQEPPRHRSRGPGRFRIGRRLPSRNASKQEACRRTSAAAKSIDPESTTCQAPAQAAACLEPESADLALCDADGRSMRCRSGTSRRVPTTAWSAESARAGLRAPARSP